MTTKPKAPTIYRKRPTFDEIRTIERQRVTQQKSAYYEPRLSDLADEINLLREDLEQARGTLKAVQGSWLTALRYCFKGRV
jgi:hypothetical protein